MNEAGYAALLSRADIAGVYIQPKGARDVLIHAAETNGYAIFIVDLRRARNRDDLLNAVAQDMAFPEWFGHNYDALHDCLCDLGWRPAEGYLVLLDHCEGIHARAAADFVNTLKIFNQAAAEWRNQGQCLWCLVDMQAEAGNWPSTLADSV